MKHLLPLLLLIGACSEYDLSRDSDRNKGKDDDVGTPVEGPQPDIKLSPETVSFGYLMVNCPADPQIITVSNVGDEPLEIDSAELVGTGSNAFNLSGSVIDLEPGESFDLTVNFTPQSFMDYEIQLVVASNDPDEPKAKADAIGHGSEYAMNEEIFKQPDVQAVDVLWVVDNSGSMSSVVETLGEKFESFIESFAALGIDYQIGVTSTDMDDPSHQGRLLGTDTIISPADADPVATFVQTTDLGFNGSADEKGLDAAYAALTEPLLSTTSDGLIRDDAMLAVVVISDEDDSSSIGHSSFSSWLNSYKGDPAHTSFSGVIGDPDNWPIGCTSSGFPPVTATAGIQYEKAINATGGIWESICDDDFNSVLSYLAYGASGLLYDFPLSKTPSSVFDIVVTVDGVVQDMGALKDWIYNPTINAVHFNKNSIPGPNTTVNVTYPVEADC